MDRLRWLAGSAVLIVVSLAQAAEPPRVHFDMPYAVACRDVTPADYTASHLGHKLVEAKLEISSLLTSGQEKDLTQYFIRVESSEASAASSQGGTAGLSSSAEIWASKRPVIVDYLPKTMHEALTSKVTSEKSTERSAALGINLSGKYELLTLPGPSAGIGQKKTSSVKYELLPPLETVAASGTLLRGSSVFFKIKSTPRNLLEGTREYALVLSVPTIWRADYLRISCQSEGIRRGIVSTFDEQIPCGQREFLVSLYLDGDEAARQIAENFARREAAKTAHAAKSNSPWAAIQR
jgi:hypothetical protein